MHHSGEELRTRELRQSKAHRRLNRTFCSIGRLRWTNGLESGTNRMSSTHSRILIRLLYTLQAYIAPFGHNTQRGRAIGTSCPCYSIGGLKMVPFFASQCRTDRSKLQCCGFCPPTKLKRHRWILLYAQITTQLFPRDHDVP